MNLSLVGRIPRFLGSRTVKNLLVNFVTKITGTTNHITTVDGCRFICQVDTQTERSAVLEGGYDDFPKKICEPFLTPEGTCIDVGANVGFWSCWFARVKTTGVVYSFEPSQRNFTRLMGNAELNQLARRIRGYRCGLSNSEETRVLYRSSDYGSLSVEKPTENSATDSNNEGVVELRMLDSFLPEINTPIEFIKIDVEGFEYEVIAGGIELIKRDKPAILFEVNAHYLLGKGVTLQSLVDLLPSEYSFYSLHGDHVRKLNCDMLLKPTDLFDVIATCDVSKISKYCM
jgi:FkbM family methyltransferase